MYRAIDQNTVSRVTASVGVVIEWRHRTATNFLQYILFPAMLSAVLIRRR
jgi:hypothetical protein